MKRGLLLDDSAISPIIGFALVLAILVTTLGFLQQHFVPVWNTEVELDHFEKVYSDMTLFTSTVGSVVATGSPQTSTINMGLKFPSRAILYNPRPTVFGRLTTDKLNVSIEYNTTTKGHQTKYYNSTTLIFELNGVVQHPKLVYEYGILIKDNSAFGPTNFTPDKSVPFFLNFDIYIPILMSNTTRKDDISITPIQKNIFPAPSDKVLNLNSSKVDITLETHYPDVWRNLIQTVHMNNTDIYVDDNTIIIRSAIITEINLPENSSDMPMQADRLYSGLAIMKFTTGV